MSVKPLLNMFTDIWVSPMSLVSVLKDAADVPGNVQSIIDILNSQIHGPVLKQFIRTCLEKNATESMREFLACMQKVYRLVYKLTSRYEENCYENPFLPLGSTKRQPFGTGHTHLTWTLFSQVIRSGSGITKQ